MTLTLLFFAGFVYHAMNKQTRRQASPRVFLSKTRAGDSDRVYDELTLSPLLRWVCATPVGLTQRMTLSAASAAMNILRNFVYDFKLFFFAGFALVDLMSAAYPA